MVQQVRSTVSAGPLFVVPQWVVPNAFIEVRSARKATEVVFLMALETSADSPYVDRVVTSPLGVEACSAALSVQVRRQSVVS